MTDPEQAKEIKEAAEEYVRIHSMLDQAYFNLMMAINAQVPRTPLGRILHPDVLPMKN